WGGGGGGGGGREMGGVGGNSGGRRWWRKMNGPTMRRCAEGRARRTVKPPMSLVRGMITRSMASHAYASPGAGSLAGKKLILHLLAARAAGSSVCPDDDAESVVARRRRSVRRTAALHVERLGTLRLAGGVDGDLLDPRLGLA